MTTVAAGPTTAGPTTVAAELASDLGVVLRDLRWTDLAAVAELELEVFPDDAWSAVSWWAELAARPRRDYLVAVDRSGLVGYAGLDHGGELSDVMTVAVAPASRGVGLGRVLVDEVVRRARARAVSSVVLEVRADNAAARRLYESVGFEVVSVRRGYYQPERVDALVLRMPLTQRRVDDA
ncbi:MAG: ribosomal protein S18-alanine N-acetyltransferase [Dermatophilaceae bacterium]